MSILEQLFNGEIHPFEKKKKKGSEYDKASRLFFAANEELRKCLGEKEQKLFEEVEEAAVTLSCIEGKEWFIEGVCLGFRFALEILQYESDNFQHLK